MNEDLQEIPLKTILQNFLNHVETLEAARDEGEDQYEKEFQALKAFSDELKTQEEYSCSEGDKEVNRKKNRYKDILPFNYSRVLLSEYPGVPGSDYINASYIKGASGSNAYIASQGPLPHTVNDFWRMVVEREVQVIVMACNEQEAGKHKCECYWTQDTDPPAKQFGMYSVSLLKSREICPDFLVRTMRLNWNGDGGSTEERTVCQFHYSAWPDHGIPTQVKPLLEMVRLIRDCQASETLPVLIHCSAGCGRTGTICVIDFVWGLLRTGKLTCDFSLYNLVQDMRRQRIAIVQTVDQYMLCHRAVRELFLEQLRVIDSHPYENVGNDGRPLANSDNSVTPDYETIFVKGQEVDIEKVLSHRQNLPKMGVGMLSREKSPSTVQSNGEGSESSENSLPATLDEFKTQSLKSTPVGTPKIQTPKIHEPPNPPLNQKESAPQRFKKGNLRLLQSEDGGWKLEELEEKRRSLETAGNKNDSFEKPDGVEIPEISPSRKTSTVSQSESKPPQGEHRKDRKKKNSRDEKSENQLLRRPSMKKIKAFFDKDKNKENKEEKETENGSEKISDSDYASAVSKLPSLESSMGLPGDKLNDSSLQMGGSKSVPSSLDRKQRYRDQDNVQVGNFENRSLEKPSNNNMSKYWPLSKKENKQPMPAIKSVSSERLPVGEKPALPVKRSKSMKSISKPVSVIPVINNSSEASFCRDQYGPDDEPSSPYDTYPKSKPRSDELIDLTKKSHESQEHTSSNDIQSNSRFTFDSKSVNQSLSDSKQTYHFGEKEQRECKVNSVAPPKPKRDWSSLNHDYANMQKVKEQNSPHQKFDFQGLTSSADFIDPNVFDKENIRSQLRDFVNVKIRRDGGNISHMRQGSGDSVPKHHKQSSGDSCDKNSEFLDQQMAKLLARKGHDETDSGNAAMKRSKSGDIPRPDNLSLVRSVSGELRNKPRNSEILDDDARKMLKDCQEYLLGEFDKDQESKGMSNSTENSPLSSLSKGGRSVHSSPGNSYNKYNQLKRSSSGNLNLSPPGTIQKSVSSPTGTIHKSICSPVSKSDHSPSSNKLFNEDYGSLQSDLSDNSSKQSPLSENGPSSLEEPKVHDYENIQSQTRNTYNLAVEARGKLNAATNVRNRERRNSFRQAVDKVDQWGRPYEQIWFQNDEETEEFKSSPRGVNSNSNIDTRLLADGPVYANASKMMEHSNTKLDNRQLRKSDASSRSQSGHIRSGSYDNIPTPGPQNSAIFTLDANPTGYEMVNFSQKMSNEKKNAFDGSISESQTTLQSVGLVQEACRDYERTQPKQVLTKQNSGGNLRMPPPYQAPPGPPGPPPPYIPPKGPPQPQFTSQPGPSPHRQHPSPQHQAIDLRYNQEPGPQVDQNTPKRHPEWRPNAPPSHMKPGPLIRPLGPSPHYPGPPPYPNQNVNEGMRRLDIGHTSPSKPRQPGPPTEQASRRQPRETTRENEPARLREGAHADSRQRGSNGGTDFSPRQRGTRDDSDLSLRHRDEHRDVRHMKRNSSLVTTARLSLGAGHPDFIIPPQGLHLRGDKQVKTVVGGTAPGIVVQGPRTAVMMGAGSTPPGIDLDKVAASISEQNQTPNSIPVSQTRQFGRSVAGLISGAAQNLKSRIVGIANNPSSSPLVRSSPSPPDSRGKVREVPIRVENSYGSTHSIVEPSERSPQVIPLTVPGAEIQQREYGYPMRLDKRPLGPRETPNFQKKQEYL